MIQQVTPEAIKTPTEDRLFPLGAEFEDAKGRLWKYVRAKEALVAGNALISDTTNKLDEDDVKTMSAVLKRYNREFAAKAQIQGRAAALTLTADYWTGGIGLVNDGDGVGQAFEVVGNTVTEIFLDEALGTALGTSNDSDIQIIQPNNVLKLIASANHAVVGIAPVAVTDEYYFWMQVTGLAPVLVGADASSLGMLVTGDNTAGTGAIAGADSDLNDVYQIGEIVIGCDTADKLCLVQLKLR